MHGILNCVMGSTVFADIHKVITNDLTNKQLSSLTLSIHKEIYIQQHQVLLIASISDHTQSLLSYKRDLLLYRALGSLFE